MPHLNESKLREEICRLGASLFTRGLTFGSAGNISARLEDGWLMSFSMYHGDRLKRITSIIDKLFRGIKPADIPWELPDRSHFALNLATAKLLGLTVPAELLLRADQVIE